MDGISGRGSIRNAESQLPSTMTQLDEGPACQSCRKRKLKCNREAPCSQCVRLSCECFYDNRRQKPGMKSGAVESLSRRLEVLEKLLLDENGDPKPTTAPSDPQGCVYHASLLIANELKNTNRQHLGQSNESSNGHTTTDPRLNCQRIHSSDNNASETVDYENSRATKRRRTDGPTEPSHISIELPYTEDDIDELPPSPLIEAIIEKYFATIHHWIPLLHQSRLENRMRNPKEAPKLKVLLHALVSATIRHIALDEFQLDKRQMEKQIRISRSVVMLNAMETLSVENLQALIIVAFDKMGCGKLSNAWAMIGSLTRTVEYLQLTVEPRDVSRHSLLGPLIILDKSRDYAEAEERKRVFWMAFLLDRFCSVTSGWNTSLTSDDVHCRLPSNGAIFARGEQAYTPFFGLWDKSAAKMGNSIAYLPTQRPSPNDEQVQNASPGGASPSVDISNVGAVAYRIEATESLSQVTSFFLQQNVDFNSRQQVGSWLTRFKELDLRLVHWKLFLPQKWKDSNVSRDESFVKMDPNLTLAHMTHNTSMILLHQHIAYPPDALSKTVNLPSSCSAETCQFAAVETASIAQKYLWYTNDIMVNSEFAFCAFVAARVLLVHWRFYEADLAPEFFSLIDCLHQMSRRWQGVNAFSGSDAELNQNTDELDVAAKYALQLQKLHAKCVEEPDFAIEILCYSGALPGMGPENIHNSITLPRRTINAQSARYKNSMADIHSPPQGLTRRRQSTAAPLRRDSENYRAQQSPASSNSPGARTIYGSHNTDRLNATSPSTTLANHMLNSSMTGMPYTNENIEDELAMMSNDLLGQQFQQMDRVITYDGTDFAFDLSNWAS